MAIITLSKGLFYAEGQQLDYGIVGNGWDSNMRVPLSRVVRYEFTTPTEGASSVSLVFPACYTGDGSRIPLRFYIGTDDSSHANGNADSEYTGDLTQQSVTSTFAGAAEIMLLPNTTYYLWVFPANAEYGYYNWKGNDDKATIEAAGAAGLARVGNLAAVPVIRINGEWKNAIPYVRVNGAWKPCG